MRKNKLIVALFILLLNGIVKSQDLIIKTNGDTIIAKVLEISISEIKYIRSDVPSMPQYSELKSNIGAIRYSNGNTETFNIITPKITEYTFPKANRGITNTSPSPQMKKDTTQTSASLPTPKDEASWEAQNKMIETTLKESDHLKSIEPVDALLNSNQITINDLKVYLLDEKAMRIKYSYNLKKIQKSKDNEEFLKYTNDVLQCFEVAYNLASCPMKLEVQNERYLFLKDLVYNYYDQMDDGLIKKYHKDLNELRPMGLKPERDGLGIGAFVSRGKDTWVGVDFSFYSSLTNRAKLTGNCNGTLISHDLESMLAVNALTFVYSSSINTQTNDFSLSLVEMNAPVVLIPAKFGFQLDPITNKMNYYYRPGIGFGYGPLSIAYSYNLMFSEAIRSVSEKSMCTIRFIYPITNHRFNTR